MLARSERVEQSRVQIEQCFGKLAAWCNAANHLGALNLVHVYAHPFASSVDIVIPELSSEP